MQNSIRKNDWKKYLCLVKSLCFLPLPSGLPWVYREIVDVGWRLQALVVLFVLDQDGLKCHPLSLFLVDSLLASDFVDDGSGFSWAPLWKCFIFPYSQCHLIGDTSGCKGFQGWKWSLTRSPFLWFHLISTVAFLNKLSRVLSDSRRIFCNPWLMSGTDWVIVWSFKTLCYLEE